MKRQLQLHTGLWRWTAQKMRRIMLIAVIWTTCTSSWCPQQFYQHDSSATCCENHVIYFIYIFPISAIQGSDMSVVLFHLLCVVPCVASSDFSEGHWCCWRCFQLFVEILWAYALKDFPLVNITAFPRSRSTAQEQSQYLGREQWWKKYWNPLLCNWKWLHHQNKFYESWSKSSSVSFLHTFCI